MSNSWTRFSDMKHTAAIYGVELCRPTVMTVVNVTPDSFYDASRTLCEEDICNRVQQAIADGCSIIDVGGCSSRPGASDVAADEEWRRVRLGIKCIRSISRDIPISVDTFRSSVAAKALAEDNRIIINDISAGEMDADIIKVAAEAGVPYIAMHMRGTPSTMENKTGYGDVTADIVEYFSRKVEELIHNGICESNILLDPGFGFAKTLDQNYELLGGLHRLAGLGFPIVAGVSRKSMIYKVTESTPAESLAGTTALHWELLRQGTAVLRVHDTREAADVIKIYNKYKSVNNR